MKQLRLHFERVRTIIELVKRREVRKLELLRTQKEIFKGLSRSETDGDIDNPNRAALSDSEEGSDDSDEEDEFIWSAAAARAVYDDETMDVDIESECVFLRTLCHVYLKSLSACSNRLGSSAPIANSRISPFTYQEGLSRPPAENTKRQHPPYSSNRGSHTYINPTTRRKRGRPPKWPNDATKGTIYSPQGRANQTPGHQPPTADQADFVLPETDPDSLTSSKQDEPGSACILL